MDKKKILKINEKVAEYISQFKKVQNNLVLVQKYRGRPKIREPEAAFLYSKVLDQNGIRYGFEVPTKHMYSFSGEGRGRAFTDLTIFYKGDRLNVEFKTDQPTQKQVDKDIEKLIKEPVSGVWFHIFTNRNKDPYNKNGTIYTLLKKFNKALSKYTSRSTKWVQFVIVVREKGEMWHFTEGKNKLGKLDLNDFGKINI